MHEFKAGDWAMVKIADVRNNYVNITRADGQTCLIGKSFLHPLPSADAKIGAVVEAAREAMEHRVIVAGKPQNGIDAHNARTAYWARLDRLGDALYALDAHEPAVVPQPAAPDLTALERDVVDAALAWRRKGMANGGNGRDIELYEALRAKTDSLLAARAPKPPADPVKELREAAQIIANLAPHGLPEEVARMYGVKIAEQMETALHDLRNALAATEPEALKNLRDRFHRCCVYTGNSEEEATGACAYPDTVIAKAEGTKP